MTREQGMSGETGDDKGNGMKRKQGMSGETGDDKETGDVRGNRG